MKEVLMMEHKVDTWRIGKIIRDVRIYTNQTQVELGRRFGKNQSFVSQLELGKIEADIETIEKICSSFDGLEVENFIGAKPIQWSSVR